MYILAINGSHKGCMGCETTNTCKIGDNFPKLFDKLLKADVLILASPNYFNNVSAMMKGFIDRMNAHWKNPAIAGKKVVLVMPGGYSKESIKRGMRAFEEFPRICKMTVDKKLMQECLELGEKLVIG